MKESIFTSDQINQFEKWGYVHLREAFPRNSALAMQDFMWTQLKQLNGIDRANRSTWGRSCGKLNKTGRHGIYKAVNSPRMIKAIRQLLGHGDWTNPGGRGGFPVSFPEDCDEPWDVVDSGWHWDGDPGLSVDSLAHLMIFTFYSHVMPKGGGTLIVAGSHRLIMPFFDSLRPYHLGRKTKPLKRQFSKSHPWLAELTGAVPSKGNRIQRFMEETTIINDIPVHVVELTGEPGDAVFCHPAIFHATSYNRAKVPRFMRVCGISQRERIQNR